MGSKNEGSVATNIGDDAVAGGVYGVMKANYKVRNVSWGPLLRHWVRRVLQLSVKLLKKGFK